MSQVAILNQLQDKFRLTYWKLVDTDEEWRKELVRNELHSIGVSIEYLMLKITKNRLSLMVSLFFVIRIIE